MYGGPAGGLDEGGGIVFFLGVVAVLGLLYGVFWFGRQGSVQVTQEVGTRCKGGYVYTKADGYWIKTHQECEASE